MKISAKKILISTVFTVLIFFHIPLFSAVISNEKLYFPLALNPEAELSTAYFYNSGLVFTPQFLFPLKAGICLDFMCDVINSTAAGKTVLGDSELKLNMLLPFDSINFLSSLSFSVLLPNGPDPSNNSDFTYLSYGKDMFSVSFLSLLRIRKLSIYSGIKYSMISNSDTLYRGIYLNPVKQKTYETLFGMNFKNKDSFLYEDNFRDDILNFNVTADYILNKSLFAGPVFQYVANWDDRTASNTGFKSSTFFLGAEIIYSPENRYGFKIQYREVMNSDEMPLKRIFLLSLFSEI